jgi:hypothetical protein
MAINVNQLTEQLRMMPDQALQRMAQMYKQDPYIFPMVISEDMARKKMRQAAQAQMVQPQPKVADQAIMAMGTPPQEAGIAQLQAPNMQNMADGGIAGYADDMDYADSMEPVVRMAYGGVARFQQGGQPRSAFDESVDFVLGVEGGDYVANDAGRGPSRWGILQSANPGVDVKKLTREQAKEIYRDRYWTAINGDELAKTDPKLAKIAFDTAVNMGPGTAQKMLSNSEGDPNKLLQLRSNRYQEIIKSNPKQYEQYAKGWENRLNKLASETVAAEPSIQSEELAKARVGAIPGSELRIGGKRYTYEGQPIPEAAPRTMGQRAVGAGETALSFLSGIPATALGTATSLGRAAIRGEAPTEKQFAEDVGRFMYSPRTEAGQEMTQTAAEGIASVLPAYIPAATVPSRAAAASRSARQAEQAAIEAATAREGVSRARLAPPGTAAMTPEQIAAAKAKIETPRLPAPGATPEQQAAGIAALEADKAAAAAARRNPTEVAATEANAARLARQQAADIAAAEGAAGRAATLAEDAATIGAQAERQAAQGARAEKTASMAGTVGKTGAALGAVDKRPIVPETIPSAVVPQDLTEKEQEKVVEAAKTAVKDPSKAEGWTNDDWLTFGFALLANRSPYFMEAVGMAGLKTLASKQEKAKLTEEKELRQAQIGKLKAESAYITETKAKSELYNRATRLAQAQINALKANPQSYGLTPEQVEEQSNAIIRRIYNQLLQQEGLGGAAPAAPAQGAIPSTPPPGAVQRMNG